MFDNFSHEQLKECASIIYDPYHQSILKSNLTIGKNLNSSLSKRTLIFDQKCADIFENTSQWRLCYRVCIRLNLISRAADILDKWSNSPGCYTNEKPIFFARSILTLLSDNKITQAIQMINSSKNILKNIDNSNKDTPPIGEENSTQLGAWHLSIILGELAAMPNAPRVDKKKLFTVLTTLYADLLDKIDSKLIDLLEKVGINVFDLGKKKAQADPMNMFQAMMNSAGGAGQKKTNKPGQIGGMDVKQLMGMLDSMQNFGK
jgi:hypothetical protein